MLRFKEHLIEKEITEYAYTFEDFVALGESEVLDEKLADRRSKS
jgi:hypothetical protein